MQLHLFFYAVLLSLSVATLLLTLTSYFVYKFRQLPTNVVSQKTKLKIEGVYFKRYLTDDLRNKLFPPQTEAQKNKKATLFSKLNQNLGVFFTIFAVIIFVSFFFENWFTRNPHFFDGKEYADRVKVLQAKGLYQRFGFNNTYETLTLDEVLPKAAVAQLEYVTQKLQKKTVYLLNTENNQKSNPVASKLALRAWIGFLGEHHISFSVTDRIPPATRGSILVLPQVAVLTEVQRAQIKSYIAQSGNILATGPIGIMDGTAKHVDSTWSSAVFSVSFAALKNAQPNVSTWFSGRGAPFWEIPPGTQINWPTIDSRYEAISSKGSVAMWEIRDELGGASARYARAVTFSNAGNRTVWTMLDPAQRNHDSANAVHRYQDLSFLTLLAWSARVPMAKVANWPDGKGMVVVPSVEVRDLNKDTKNVAKTLNELKIPTSFFASSSDVKDFVDFRKSLSNVNEIVLRLESAFDLSTDDFKVQLEKIENARLEMEYQTGEVTTGFHLQEGSYNLDTVKSLIQNRISYLSAETAYFRLAPSFISQGDFLILPGSLVNDREMGDDQEIKEKTFLRNKFASILGIIAELQGMYVLKIRPANFKDAGYKDLIPETLKKLKADSNTEFLSMNEVVNWWKGRNQIELTISEQGTSNIPRVLLSNNSDDSIAKIAVWIDDGVNAKLMPLGNLGGLSEAKIDYK